MARKPLGDWISIAAAAELLGLSYQTVWRMVQRGDLASRRLSPSKTQVRRNDVLERLEPQGGAA